MGDKTLFIISTVFAISEISAISEIFDGKNPKPNLGRGTMQQAWSVSNIIKVMIDFDLTGNKIEI